MYSLIINDIYIVNAKIILLNQKKKENIIFNILISKK